MAVNIDRVAMGLAEELLACLCTALAETTGGAPCFCCASAGERPPAMDYCCDCGQGHGQAWVRVVRIFPAAARFPQLSTDVEQCRLGSWGVELEVGAYRCAAVPDNRGNPPSCARVTRDAEVIVDDAAAMRRAITCCFASSDRDQVVGEWRPIGPSGGCVGGSMTVQVRASDCCPPQA